MNNIQPKDWFYLGQWQDNVIDSDFWLHWGEVESIQKITKVKCNSNIIRFDGHFYFWLETHNKIKKESYKAAASKKSEYYDNFFKVTRDVVDNLSRVNLKLKVLKKLNRQNLDYFFEEYQKLFGPWLIIFPITEGFEKYFNERLAYYKISLEEIQPLLKPSKDPGAIRQLQEVGKFVKYLEAKQAVDILKIKSYKKIFTAIGLKYPDLKIKIEKHVKDFGWVGVHHFWGEPLSVKKVIVEMQDKFKEAKVKKNVIKNPAVPNEVSDLVLILNNLAYFRFMCAEASGESVYLIWNQLHLLAKKLGVTYEEMCWFNRQEILVADEKSKKLSKKIALERSKNFGHVYVAGNEEILVGGELEKLEQKFFIKALSENLIIEGVVASKGEPIVGRARIVLKPQQMKDFKKGDILISPETTPDFLPAMKLAAAIVTDRGGLTSHAAIVARELGKPCVIATKNATQIIKNNDIIEVDANTGVIKILSQF